MVSPVGLASDWRGDRGVDYLGSRPLAMPISAWVVFSLAVMVGVHVGLLPPVMPGIRADFSMGLVAAGWLLSMVQIGSMLLGFTAGSFAESVGRARLLLLGCVGIAIGDLFCSMAYTFGQAWPLFLGRAVASLGQVCIVVSAPALMMRLVSPARQGLSMGIYASYMPLGMAIGMLLAPFALTAFGPRGVWFAAIGLVLLLVAGFLALVWPKVAEARQPWQAQRAWQGFMAAIRFKKPLLLAACFALYGTQWISVMSWLPSYYAGQEVVASVAASLTAVAVIANCVGNVLGGWLLGRGLPRWQLCAVPFVVMLVCAYLLFARPQAFAVGFAALLLFSAVGGVVPGVLFASSKAYSPNASAIPSTVGVMTQGVGLGQMAGPPILALLVQTSGGWQSSWLFNAVLAVLGLLTCYLIASADADAGSINDDTKASKLS